MQLKNIISDNTLPYHNTATDGSGVMQMCDFFLVAQHFVSFQRSCNCMWIFWVVQMSDLKKSSTTFCCQRKSDPIKSSFLCKLVTRIHTFTKSRKTPAGHGAVQWCKLHVLISCCLQKQVCCILFVWPMAVRLKYGYLSLNYIKLPWMLQWSCNYSVPFPALLNIMVTAFP